jgi:hypothetical protein
MIVCSSHGKDEPDQRYLAHVLPYLRENLAEHEKGKIIPKF